MTDKYGWCHTTQCVAEWSWGQSANNLFTLLGAIATFAAALLALRFSQAEARRRAAEDEARANIFAVSRLHVVRDMDRFILGVRMRLAEVANPDENKRVQEQIAMFVEILNTHIEVLDESAMVLSPLRNSTAVRLVRAFSRWEHLKEERPAMWAVLAPEVHDGCRHERFAYWASVLDSMTTDLRASLRTLEVVAGQFPE